jgi:hypothetical protein
MDLDIERCDSTTSVYLVEDHLIFEEPYGNDKLAIVLRSIDDGRFTCQA